MVSVDEDQGPGKNSLDRRRGTDCILQNVSTNHDVLSVPTKKGLPTKEEDAMVVEKDLILPTASGSLLCRLQIISPDQLVNTFGPERIIIASGGLFDVLI